MSANILKFPEPSIRPDLAKCHAAIELCDGDPHVLLFAPAHGVDLVRNPRPELNPKDSPEQLAVDRLMIAFLALAEVLGLGELVS
jgi:hypothetical protein